MTEPLSAPLSERFHVVLVEPGNSANVGAVARAMANLGFAHLHLIAPRRYDRDLAAVSACWATPLLDALQIHDDLPTALLSMHDVVGFSMRAGINPPHWMDLPQWVSELVAVTSAPQGRTALVFGPEENGLTTLHLEHCRRIVRIPSAAACPSFNLAQSVLLVLYELTRSVAPVSGSLTPCPSLASERGESETSALVSVSALNQTKPEPQPTLPDSPLSLAREGQGVSDRVQSSNAQLSISPTRADIAPLERLLDTVMRESGFVRPGSPATIPGVVRNLFRRLQMDRHELGVLMGLFGRLQTTIRRSQPEPADITLSQEHR